MHSASLYTNNRYGTVWFVYLGSAACGIGVGVFWVVEGAIMLSCMSPRNSSTILLLGTLTRQQTQSQTREGDT